MNARFSGTGHGAAACSTSFRLDEVVPRRASRRGSASRRWKFAGTMCVLVTRSRSMIRAPPPRPSGPSRRPSHRARGASAPSRTDPSGRAGRPRGARRPDRAPTARHRPRPRRRAGGSRPRRSPPPSAGRSCRTCTPCSVGQPSPITSGGIDLTVGRARPAPRRTRRRRRDAVRRAHRRARAAGRRPRRPRSRRSPRRSSRLRPP